LSLYTNAAEEANRKSFYYVMWKYSQILIVMWKLALIGKFYQATQTQELRVSVEVSIKSRIQDCGSLTASSTRRNEKLEATGIRLRVVVTRIC